MIPLWRAPLLVASAAYRIVCALWEPVRRSEVDNPRQTDDTLDAEGVGDRKSSEELFSFSLHRSCRALTSS